MSRNKNDKGKMSDKQLKAIRRNYAIQANKNKQKNQNNQSNQDNHIKPYKPNLKVCNGAAFRTRDEFLEGGIPKEEYIDNPNQYYRVIYTIAINSNNELAVVRRTSSKGRHLKSQPQYKFHEQVYTKDNDGNGIKGGKKFVRSIEDDITQEDVNYINKRISYYPDTAEKMKEFKNRNNNKKPPK